MTGNPPRKDIWIPKGQDQLAAWYYPAPSGERGPVIVCGHGLGATRAMGLDGYAEVFQKAGYAAIAFDYAGFGDSKGPSPRQVLNFYTQQDDWDAVLKYARNMPEVDPAKVGIFGSSFGGGHVIYLAARDQKVAAVISQCPFTNGFSSSLTLGVLPTILMTPLIIADILKSFFSDKIVPISLTGKPGQVALMNAHDAEDGYGALKPAGTNIIHEVGARVGLQIPLLRPGAQAKNVKCPIHVAVCMQDTVAPPGPTLKYVRQAPKAEVVEHDMGHFSIYKGENFNKATAMYVNFLKRNIPPSAKL